MALSASWIATWVIAYMRDSLSGLSAGAMHAASAACPACAFHAVTAFGLECGLALAGAAITAAVVSESVKKRMNGTVASKLSVRTAADATFPDRDGVDPTGTCARDQQRAHVSAIGRHECATDRSRRGTVASARAPP